MPEANIFKALIFKENIANALLIHTHTHIYIYIYIYIYISVCVCVI